MKRTNHQKHAPRQGIAKGCIKRRIADREWNAEKVRGAW